MYTQSISSVVELKNKNYSSAFCLTATLLVPVVNRETKPPHPHYGSKQTAYINQPLVKATEPKCRLFRVSASL